MSCASVAFGKKKKSVNKVAGSVMCVERFGLCFFFLLLLFCHSVGGLRHLFDYPMTGYQLAPVLNNFPSSHRSFNCNSPNVKKTGNSIKCCGRPITGDDQRPVIWQTGASLSLCDEYVCACCHALFRLGADEQHKPDSENYSICLNTLYSYNIQVQWG